MTHVLLSASGGVIASGRGPDFHHVAPDERVVEERPLLFSAPMVRALLAGTKTQTRRIAKDIDEKPLAVEWGEPTVMRRGLAEPGTAVFAAWFDESHVPCPYGAPGDRLWVRETWGSVDADHPRVVEGRKPQRGDRLVFRANPADDYQWGSGKGSQGGFVWRPSIHMPRWASRLTLEVTGVRVERLQDISEADAKAEGVEPYKSIGPGQCIPGPGFNGAVLGTQPHRLPFADLWRDINGAESWDANPWVWVVEFKRVSP